MALFVCLTLTPSVAFRIVSEHVVLRVAVPQLVDKFRGKRYTYPARRVSHNCFDVDDSEVKGAIFRMNY